MPDLNLSVTTDGPVEFYRTVLKTLHRSEVPFLIGGTFAMENGGPAFVLTDSKGKGVIRLQVPKVPDKAALYLSDPTESTDAELAMTQTGPVLHFNDRVGNRIRLATNELNAPLAAVYDAEGKKVFEVTGKK